MYVVRAVLLRAAEPTYNTVCRGDGHTEAIKIEYDPSIVSYDKLLDVFFKEHTPVRKSKAQYKSAVWVHDKAQKEKVEQKIKEVQSSLGREVRHCSGLYGCCILIMSFTAQSE